MDFTIPSDEQELAALVRSIAGDHLTERRLRALDGADVRIDRELWTALARRGRARRRSRAWLGDTARARRTRPARGARPVPADRSPSRRACWPTAGRDDLAAAAADGSLLVTVALARGTRRRARGTGDPRRAARRRLGADRREGRGAVRHGRRRVPRPGCDARRGARVRRAAVRRRGVDRGAAHRRRRHRGLARARRGAARRRPGGRRRRRRRRPDRAVHASDCAPISSACSNAPSNSPPPTRASASSSASRSAASRPSDSAWPTRTSTSRRCG